MSSVSRSTRTIGRGLLLLVGLLALPTNTPAAGIFKVCADPNNPPYSTKDEKGFENKIARLLADRLDQKIEYTWFPQRMGFIRNTLKAKIEDSDDYKCDVIMGVPERADMVATTSAYYRSIYMMVFRRTGELEKVRSPEDVISLPDSVKSKLKIAAYDHQPGTDWILKNGLIGQGIPYQSMTGDVSQNPAQVLAQDFTDKKIDLAIVWGPIASYVVRTVGSDLSMTPMKSDKAIRFDYPIAMGVRVPDQARKKLLDELIKKEQKEIISILNGFSVPLVDDQGSLVIGQPQK